jgi:hypothetical protein
MQAWCERKRGDSRPSFYFDNFYVGPPPWPICQIFEHVCRPGYVYIVRYSDLYKIGFTKSLENVPVRMSEVARKFEMRDGDFIYAIETNCARGFERYLHKVFARWHWANEFYRLGRQDLIFLTGIGRFNLGPVVHHPQGKWDGRKS